MHLLRIMMTIPIVLMASCAASYRAQSRADACSSGYSETKEADGHYRVTYVGPARSIRGVSALARRRASELCPSGYSAVQDKDVTSILCPGNVMYGMRGVPAAVLTVTCKSGS